MVVPASVNPYNSLPTLGHANTRFTNRDQVFSGLAPLFAAHGNQFGLCLVHRHCDLDENERIVSRGSVSEPVRDGPAYPERWLANGTPYEYSATPTPAPPPELVVEFQRVVGPHADVLGLFYAGEVSPGTVKLERTEGRRNVTEDVDELGAAGNHIETGWCPGAGDSVAMKCVVTCLFDVETQRQHIGTTHY
jgi:hypothetical protein